MTVPADPEGQPHTDDDTSDPRVVIVGAGHDGVELAAPTARLTARILSRYPNVGADDVH